jgi:acetolactate synthase-1/2/3 large subunit
MCYDAWLQEAPLAAPVALPAPAAPTTPSRIAPDPQALAAAAEEILAADWPVLMPEFVGRVSSGFSDMVALAETLGAPVFDVGTRLNFPTEHPLDLRLMPEAFKSADLIVGLDLKNWERPTHYNDRINRTKRSYYPESCRWIDIGFADIEISKWAMDYQRFPESAHRVLADTALAIPQLTALCRARIGGEIRLQRRIAERRDAVARMHDAQREKWREEAREDWDASPISLARLASEVWEQIQGEDWVLTTNAFENWALKLWDFDRHYRHAGKPLGTGTQIGIAMGVALAHRAAGRLVVDCQTDGDLMFDAGALWFAAKHKVPMLAVMHNNRAYYNDWEHQITVARQRATPVERAYIGMDISGPNPDFAGLARAMGWHAEGPIEDPAEIAGTLARAIAAVKRGTPALVDTVTQHRG